jgi:hypothetical protein
VLPLVDGKHSWKPFQEWLPSDEQLHVCFATGSAHAIGTICGAVSGNLIAIDFDAPGFFGRFRELMKTVRPDLYDLLAQAIRVRTRKGTHMLFRSTDPVGPNTKLAYVVDVDGKQKIAVETRGEGGYVVAPPSVPYKLEGGDYANLPVISGENVTVILDVIRSLSEVVPKTVATVVGEQPTVSGDGLRPGDDFNARGDALKILLDHGWTIVADTGGRHLLRRPGKTEGVSATFGYGDSNLLYVFSSNAQPFDSEKAYSPFAVKAILDYNGDYGACAKACRAEGYGGDIVDPATPVIVQPQWEPIIPLRAGAMPAFPTHIYPPDLARFIESAAYSVQVPADLIGMMMLAVFGSLVAKTIDVEITPTYHEQLSMMTCAIMPPASRKSAACSIVTKPLIRLDTEINNFERDAVRHYETQKGILQGKRQDLLKKLEHVEDESAKSELENVDASLDSLEVVHKTTLWMDDATPEALVASMAENGGRMGILSPEGSVFEMMAGRYSGKPNLDVYLKGHVGDTIRVNRKAASPEARVITIERPALSIGIMVQPDVLSSLSSKSIMTGRGLMARFLYAFPADLVGKRIVGTSDISAKSIADYERTVRIFGDWRQKRFPADWEPHNIRLTTEARQVYEEWAAEVERSLGCGDLRVIREWGGKLVGATVRVAGLLHLLSNRDRVEPWTVGLNADTMRNAIEFGKYCIPHAIAAHHEIHGDRQLEKALRLARWIQEKSERSFTARDVMRSLHAFQKAADVHSVAEILVDHGYIAIDGSAGGMAKKFVVNPDLFRLASAQPVLLPQKPIAEEELRAAVEVQFDDEIADEQDYEGEHNLEIEDEYWSD